MSLGGVVSLGYAAELGLLAASPLDRISWRPPGSRFAAGPQSAATPAEVQTILAEVTRIRPELTAFFGCLYYAALRPAEAVALRATSCTLPASGWGQLTLTGSLPRSARAWTGNGTPREPRGLKHRPAAPAGQSRSPRNSSGSCSITCSTYGSAADGRLFRGARGGPLSESRYGRIWHQARNAAAMPGAARLRPYDLRHAALSLWLASGAPPAEVAARAGHSVRVLLTIVAAGVVVWSLMTSLSSVARSFVSLALARMGVGIGEATLSPCAFSMISDSFPKERLGSALSVYTMGIQLGSGLALIIGGVVAQAVSHMAPLAVPLAGSIAPWRLTFLMVGAPGLLIALLLFTVREPARRALLLDSSGAPARLGLRECLAQVRERWRSTLGLSLIIACQATCNYALLGWSPTFFDRLHHWPKDRTGLVLGLTTLGCGCAGLFVGGRLSIAGSARGSATRRCAWD